MFVKFIYLYNFFIQLNDNKNIHIKFIEKNKRYKKKLCKTTHNNLKINIFYFKNKIYLYKRLNKNYRWIKKIFSKIKYM